MQIDETLLTKLETLSSLKIEPKNRQNTIKQLSEIVNFVENLNELDLKNEDATFTTVEGGTPFREDEPSSQKEVIETILHHAPNSHRRFFVVPAIIE